MIEHLFSEDDSNQVSQNLCFKNIGWQSWPTLRNNLIILGPKNVQILKSIASYVLYSSMTWNHFGLNQISRLGLGQISGWIISMLFDIKD